MASTVAAEPPAALGRPDGPASPCDHGSAAAVAVTLLSLPTELHLAVSRYLPYPDALSLKQTSTYFRQIVRTDVPLKVEWLLERRRLHLDCPNSHRCDLGSDLQFCRGSVSIRAGY
ncbi:hypothetical protein HC256_001171 [Beauveria bassiana]|uniref:F-box domain-containing protein n=1 Tax=Beauveria bassiana (strain ARSEF 2860) TaxID=655819 RepID=J4UTL3_BEAB2|nr:F-box domain-containing protein [Beauveria bassiana ARSEF 2860]EJP69187.1 F-box domain-containing protein [Beauveria bassiana ARSEF 2860]KAH8720788.1 hypothetical protein HC256_001171 [Beauveria bassiana]